VDHINIFGARGGGITLKDPGWTLKETCVSTGEEQVTQVTICDTVWLETKLGPKDL